MPGRYRVLGTDGFGRSDYRGKLRHFFEVDRHWVALAALESLAKEGAHAGGQVAEAIKKYGIDPEKPNPRHRLSAGGCDNGQSGVRRQAEEDGMAIEVKVPDIGDFKDVPVIEIHVKAGDKVNDEDPLVTLESDKATMDVPAARAARSRRSWSRPATG